MKERKRNGRNIIEKGQNVLEESVENRLSAAAGRIVPDEAARERIIESVKVGGRSRRRLTPRIPAAVLAACLLLFFLCFARPGVIGQEVVVYAATEEHGWQKLVEGERILLKQETFETIRRGGGIEDFDERGYPTYYPYKCTFRVEVPENYLYDNTLVTLGDDTIVEWGGIIQWWLAPERPEDAGKVRQGTMRIWIVSERIVKARRERIAALDLELTKEDGKCYAELKRVWESSGYKRHKK